LSSQAFINKGNTGWRNKFLRFLGEAVSEVAPEAGQPSRLRLYDDKRFVLEGYRFLREQNPDYLEIEETGHLMILTAPTDLRRRLGAPDARGDVVFGATAIPVEAWPDHHQFRLTDNPEQVELAIKAARNTSGYWSHEMLCTDQHPILQWITERLLMLMRRGECPLILSRYLEPGELCFCCIGQVSSRTGVPLVVDAHAIAFHKGGSVQQRSLREALTAAGFDCLVNTGRQGNIEAARLLIPAAVDASLAHLTQLRMALERQLIPLLRAEERRLRQWRNRRHELLETRIAHLGASHPRARRYRKDLEEVDAYVRDRQGNWRDTHFTASQEPSTRVVLVIEGTH
jgi:hypothetical protein